MIAFRVNDMTCGHCASTIATAVREVDKDAAVRIDLALHRVEIESEGVDASVFAQALKRAGYSPVTVAT